jgi:catechol 2,3-dioxygenase-like lactoylglutathione lyase family enzyme
MEPRISLITLGVSDLARATAFYRDGLGWATHGEYEGVTFIPLRGIWLSLYPRENLAADALASDAQVAPPGSGFPGFTLAHNVASPEEVDKVLEHAIAAGATLRKPAQKAEWGGYSGYFADPDGFLWEVAWNPDFDLT